MYNVYTINIMVKIINFNYEKNILLKETRWISFENVIEILENKIDLLDDIFHPNIEKYPNQKIFIIKFKNYFYSVPYIESEKEIFLKTIFPDRKLLKNYKNKL